MSAHLRVRCGGSTLLIPAERIVKIARGDREPGGQEACEGFAAAGRGPSAHGFSVFLGQDRTGAPPYTLRVDSIVGLVDVAPSRLTILRTTCSELGRSLDACTICDGGHSTAPEVCLRIRP